MKEHPPVPHGHYRVYDGREVIVNGIRQQCNCEFVDVGVGPLMKVAENYDCPVCNPEERYEPMCSCFDYKLGAKYFWGTVHTGTVTMVAVTYRPDDFFYLQASGRVGEGQEINPGCPHHGL